MVRVLQIVPDDADDQTFRGSEALSQRLGDEAVRTMRLGRAPLRNIPSALLWLRQNRPAADVVHAWGPQALSVAALGTSLPILYCPTSGSRRAIDWARAISGYRRVEIACSTATLQRMHVERGVPAERVHLIRPGVDFATARGRRSEQLRAALGIKDEDRVVLLPGESTRAAGHLEGAWAVAILNVLDQRYKALVWGRGKQTGAVRHLGGSTAGLDPLRVAEERIGRVDFATLLQAADMVLVPARGAVPVLSIATAMAAAVPIVSAVTYTTAELLEDRHTALMCSSAQPRQLARRMLELEADPALRWKLGDMARTEAFEYFAMSRFVAQYQSAYQQLAAGPPLSIAQPAPGAGMRFHGRGPSLAAQPAGASAGAR